MHAKYTINVVSFHLSVADFFFSVVVDSLSRQNIWPNLKCTLEFHTDTHTHEIKFHCIAYGISELNFMDIS